MILLDRAGGADVQIANRPHQVVGSLQGVALVRRVLQLLDDERAHAPGIQPPIYRRGFRQGMLLADQRVRKNASIHHPQAHRIGAQPHEFVDQIRIGDDLGILTTDARFLPLFSHVQQGCLLGFEVEPAQQLE
ncbi:MAG: hypothetical protein JNJ76_05500 [Candidatus Competibacter sp.]|nr:hypothetical protein [Candidatus Competibacter sp.]